MTLFSKKLPNPFSGKHAKAFRIVGLLLVLIALPLTISFSKQQQITTQEADTTPTYCSVTLAQPPDGYEVPLISNATCDPEEDLRELEICGGYWVSKWCEGHNNNDSDLKRDATNACRGWSSDRVIRKFGDGGRGVVRYVVEHQMVGFIRDYGDTLGRKHAWNYLMRMVKSNDLSYGETDNDLDAAARAIFGRTFAEQVAYEATQGCTTETTWEICSETPPYFCSREVAVSTGRIQGRVTIPTGKEATITITGPQDFRQFWTLPTEAGSNVYISSNELVGGSAYTVTASTIPGYDAYYSLTDNSIEHPDTSYIKADSVSVTIPPNGYADLYWKYVSTTTATTPNCSITDGPDVVMIGHSATFTGTFYSPQGLLTGVIQAYKPDHSTNGGILFAPWRSTDYPKNFGGEIGTPTSGTHTFTWTPAATLTPGNYHVFCRAWNDSVEECTGDPDTINGTYQPSICTGTGTGVTAGQAHMVVSVRADDSGGACTTDANCSATQKCTDGTCVAVSCGDTTPPCKVPKIENHACNLENAPTGTTCTLGGQTGSCNATGTCITDGTGDTVVDMTVFIHGIGKGGDSKNPNGGGNTDPNTKSREVIIELFDPADETILKATGKGSIHYQAATGNFKGSATFANLTTGTYIVKVKTETQTLRKRYPGIVTVTKGQTTTLPTAIRLVTGDIDAVQNNSIDIHDYNILSGCFSESLPAKSCTAAQKQKADLTDDGKVNKDDLAIFIREILVQNGD